MLVAVGSLRSLIDEREEPWSATVLGRVLIAAACGLCASSGAVPWPSPRSCWAWRR
ncbi:hypothetical protein [Streptomyces bluensis]|uniref:hypothetical protein n=1 Tax=Streptomyces bluensis TaxID=33897 RepID=UPI00167393A1|nr:hypothetical protein [Streptomyces bluensis]